ncbi:MAG: hypothetical protein LAT76_11440 [Schleiferiaceae bacterium]|nr:hypothetical protein [Schleiferiaceae bacterium]
MKKFAFNLSGLGRMAFLGAMTVALTVGTSCSKDDDSNGNGNNNNTPPPPPPNELVHDGETIAMTKGFFLDYGQASATSYNLDLFLLTENADLSLTTGNLTGSGSMFYIELFTSANDKLEPGTYTFDASNTPEANTFDTSVLLKNFNLTEGNQGTLLEVSNGTVKVEFKDGKYEFTIDLVDENGAEIKGYYRNEVQTFPARIGQDEITKESLRAIISSEVQ